MPTVRLRHSAGLRLKLAEGQRARIIDIGQLAGTALVDAKNMLGEIKRSAVHDAFFQYWPVIPAKAGMQTVVNQ